MNRRMRRALPFVCAAALALATAGCLGEPKLEDRWTRIDITGANVTNGQNVTAGATMPVQVGADITYRRILTGFAVAELRASTTLAPGTVRMRSDADRLQMATDIDQLLETSVSMGRMTRAVTGWDHLIQHVDFTFAGRVPAGTVTDSTGTGPLAGLFLVVYMGSGVEIELPDGSDSIAVTPFKSGEYQVLPVGMPLTVVP